MNEQEIEKIKLLEAMLADKDRAITNIKSLHKMWKTEALSLRKQLAGYRLIPEQTGCLGTLKCSEIDALGELNFVDETAWDIAVNDYCGKCQERIKSEQTDMREAAADKIDDLLARCGVGAYCSVELRQQELETADQILDLLETKVLSILGANPYDPTNENNVQRRSAVVMLRQGYESGKHAQFKHDQATVGNKEEWDGSR